MPTLHQYDDDCYTVGAPAADLSPHLRIKLTSGGAATLAGDEAAIGTLTERGASSAENAASVRSAAAPSSVMVAAKAIAVGDVVNSAAGGKVTDAAGAVLVGIAKTAASADDDLLLVLKAG